MSALGRFGRFTLFHHLSHLPKHLPCTDLSFPCVLPQMINFPVLQAFLSPLLPQGLSCLSLQMWHNGAAVDYQLVSCFNGFFIQITVEVNSILMENIRLAAPLIIPQLHIDQMVLTDPQLLQVTAFVPGGDTLISSRSLTMTDKRKWEAKKHYFSQYKKDGCRPPCIDLDTAIQGFDIDNTAAYQAIEDSKALHARRWQTKDGMYRIKFFFFCSMLLG